LQHRPDAEAQEEARFRRGQRGRQGLKLVLATSLLGFAAGLFSSSLFWITDVRVVAPDSALARAVCQAISLPGHASSIFYPLSRLERQATTLPQVESVAIAREGPHQLVVRVTRRLPIAGVLHEKGLLLVGADGVITNLVPTGEKAPRLPLFVGIAVEQAQPGGCLNAESAALVAQAAQAALTGGLGAGFRLDCSQRLDLRVSAGGVEGLLGATDNLERKVGLFAALLTELRRQGGDPAYIDVRVMDRPVWMPKSSMSAPAPAATPPA